jgi:hypothetical protein
MAEEKRKHEIALKRVVYEIAGAENVPVRRDIAYATVDGERLTMDLYFPAETTRSEPTAAVVFVVGYPDKGVRRVVGCAAKEMASYVSWAQLVAASGLVAVTYTNQDPARDARHVMRYLRDHSDALGIDRGQLALWACSGNGPTALSLLMDPDARIRRAAFCYAYLLDADGETAVADAARRFGFANPCAGRSVEEVPSDVPLLIVRAGNDEMPGLNASSDRVIARALERNLPITVTNHRTGPHAFDLFDDSEEAKNAIEHVLAFLRPH